MTWFKCAHTWPVSIVMDKIDIDSYGYIRASYFHVHHFIFYKQVALHFPCSYVFLGDQVWWWWI